MKNIKLKFSIFLSIVTTQLAFAADDCSKYTNPYLANACKSSQYATDQAQKNLDNSFKASLKALPENSGNQQLAPNQTRNMQQPPQMLQTPTQPSDNQSLIEQKGKAKKKSIYY